MGRSKSHSAPCRYHSSSTRKLSSTIHATSSRRWRVSAELPRPTVTLAGDFGVYDVEMLRVASLARTTPIRLTYLHICSPVYCLKESTRYLSLACPHVVDRPLHSDACVTLWCMCALLLHSARKHTRVLLGGPPDLPLLLPVGVPRFVT